MLDKIGALSPFPYYINHVLIAALISLAPMLAGYAPQPLIGGGFYAIREVIQWRQKGYWDGKGFTWPVAAMAIADLALRLT